MTYTGVTNQQLLVGFDLSKAGEWKSESLVEGVVNHHFQWNQEQWRQIERSAFNMLLETMSGAAPWAVWGDAIPPEALDYMEEAREGLFTEEEMLDAAATAIGVVDAILSQFEEEAAKRDG